MRIGLARIAIAGCLLFALALAASPVAASQTAYYDSYLGEDLTGFAIGSGGAIGSPVPGSPFAADPGGNEGMVISPDGKNLYVWGNFGGLFEFAIGVDGSLTPLPGSPLNVNAGPFGITVSPDGAHVYGADQSDGQVLGFARAADGTLTALPGSPWPSASLPSGVAIAPSGSFLYVASVADDTISAYSVAADGTLSELAGSPFGNVGEPYSLNVSPDGGHLYVGDRTDDEVHAFAIGGGGALTEISGSPYPSQGINPFGTTITPDGRHLYVGNADDDKLAEFNIAADGSLSSPGGSPLNLAYTPGALFSDVSSTRLYVATTGGLGTQTDVFSIGPDGALTPLADSPFDVGVRGDFQSVVLSPEQPPVAAFTVKPRRKNVVFDASASADADGTVVRYAWDFGDGTTFADNDVTQAHKYAKGTYTATLTVTDDDGCSATYLAAGQTPFCSGSDAATATQEVDRKRPKIKLRGDKTQELGEPIVITVKSNENGSTRANGSLILARGQAKGKLKLREVRAKLKAKKQKKLKLKLSGKARTASARADAGQAKITVVVTDTAKNEVKAKRTIRLG